MVIVNRDAFADALSATPLAKIRCTDFVNRRRFVNTKTESEIAKLNPDNILIIGGTISVSKNVENTLKNTVLSIVLEELPVTRFLKT